MLHIVREKQMSIPKIVNLKRSRKWRHVEVMDLTDDNDSVHCCCRKTSRTNSNTSNTSNTRMCAESYSFSAKMANQQLSSVMDGVLASNAEIIAALHQVLDVERTRIVAIDTTLFDNLTPAAQNTFTARMIRYFLLF